MTEFKAGDKVRINEGLLEGQTGTVVKWGQYVTLVSLEDTAFGGGSLTFYTATLVPASEPHEALTAVKLYPDILKSNRYRFQITTLVDGIPYVSIPVNAKLLLEALSNPPAGLAQVECRLSAADTPQGVSWKLLWAA